MRMAIILNGVSRKRNLFFKNFYPQLKAHFEVQLFETAYSGHAFILSKEATANGFDTILAAGGDGTLHQVLNGILQSEAKTFPALGLIPLGSANDFARTVGQPTSADYLINLLQKNAPSLLDVGKVKCNDEKGYEITRYFINVCSLGMGPLVVKRLERNRKKWGVTLSYLSSILTTFFTHKPQHITCTTSDWVWEGKARVVAVANGTAFGNGIYIAPDALLNDRLLNSFIAENVPLWKFLFYLQTLKSKKKIVNEHISYKTIRLAQLTSAISCALEAEGELIGFLPATIEVQPAFLKFYR